MPHKNREHLKAVLQACIIGRLYRGPDLMNKMLLLAAALIAAMPSSAQITRFYNNDAVASREVAVTCGGVQRTIAIAPHASADADCSDAEFTAPADVTVVRADATHQWSVRSEAECANLPLLLPPFGCVSGAATAAVSELAGAAYSWSVDGASIVSGNGGGRIELKLGSGDSAKVSVTVHAGDCTTTSNGVIKLTNPPIVHDLAVSSAQLFQPVTITWQREGDIKSQTLTGTDFDSPIALAPDAASYTYTPSTEGNKVVVLDAVAVKPAGNNSAGGRRRSSATQPVNATMCASATARLEYAIGNCKLPDFRVTVPSAVKPGGTFSAEIVLFSTPDTPPSFNWTVTNGTPSGSTSQRSISIVAGASGQVSIAAEVRMSATCVAAVKKTIEISNACSNPTATVAPLVSDCRKSQVKVSFTGRPPFSGAWSDGLEFTTNENGLIRDVQTGGTYTLRSFHDALCAGTITGSAVMNPPGSVSISMKGSSCANGRIVAKFIGTPPFSGYWSDSRETFTTNDYSIEHAPVPGMPNYFLTAFHDASCTDPNQLRVSNSLTIPDAPTANLRIETTSTLCSTPDRGVLLVADVAGDPPIHVKWSDGLVQDLPYTPARRVIWPEGKTSGSATYSILEASDAHCPAVIRNASLTVRLAAWPYVIHPDGENFKCSGTNSTATLLYPPPARIPIVWSITNGTIVSGQGTGTLTWKAGAPGTDITVTAKYDYGMNDCATTGTMLPKPHVREVMKAPVVSPYDITCDAGKSVDFTLLVDNQTEAWGVYQGLTSEVALPSCKDNPDGTHTCKYTYTNKTGAGSKTITIDYFNTCENRTQAFFTIVVK